MNKSDAIEVFVSRSVKGGYDSTIEYMNTLLKEGPRPQKTSGRYLRMHQWYKELDDDQKNIIQEIINETAYSVLFGIMVLIDNLTMGYPIKDKLSDFALYIQTYRDGRARSANQYEEAIRLNDTHNLIDLHDLIGDYINRETT